MRIQWEAAWKARLLRNHMRPGASTPTFFAAAGCPRGSCTWGIEERARRPTPVVQLPSSPSWAGWPQEDESSPLLLAIRLMTSSREEAAPPQPRVPPAGLRPGWGRLSGDCRRRKPLPPGTQSLREPTGPRGRQEGSGATCSVSSPFTPLEESGSHPNVFINRTEEL